MSHQVRRDMAAVSAWVMVQDRPDDAGPGEVRTALDILLAHPDLAVVAGSKSLVSIWEMEERIRSSVYAAAQTVVWPWADPGVAAASRGQSVTLDWLLSEPNTMYLGAPIEDQQHLAPASAGCSTTSSSRSTSVSPRPESPWNHHCWSSSTKRATPRWRALPEYASTHAGLGVLLVTIWQSLDQLQAACGRQADTILTNHLSKVFYAGLSEPVSLRYVAQVLGDEEVEVRSRSADTSALGRAACNWPPPGCPWPCTRNLSP